MKLLDILIHDFIPQINGVIHVGAHHGQETSAYRKYNIKNIAFIEPSPEAYKILLQQYKQDLNIDLYNLAAGSFNGVANFFVETKNNGQSNSLLKPKTHLNRYPRIKFNDTISVNVQTLDTIIVDKSKFNLLVLDIQGYELEALKGATELLSNIDYIITEVNMEELYEYCAMIHDMDSFLLNYSFHRQDTHWGRKGWGDALYVKKLPNHQ